MTEPVPSVVVSLPARTVAEARQQIRDARAAGADLAELRIDRFSEEERAVIGTLFPSPLPLVATVRSRSEGGEGPDDPDVRAKLLSQLSRHPFRWIDVEATADLPAADSLALPGVRDLIVSTHLPDGADVAEWTKRFREAAPPGSVRKVVGRSAIGALLQSILPQLPPPGDRRLVALSTGPSGPLFRAWSRRLGFPLVFASLPDVEIPSERPPVEASQIPVDRLKPFLVAEGSPPLFAIAGHPVAHSRSPAVHHHWMEQDRHTGLFVPLDFESDTEFTEALPHLWERGFRGLSVTHPLKAVAFEVADRTSPGAEACGVANTLTFGPEGIEAENTDLAAVLRRLGELRRDGRWDGGAVGVIGAGGAARATLAALRSLGAETHVWSRRPEAAERLAEEFGAHVARGTESSRPLLVIHATPVGREALGAAPPPELGWLRSGGHLLDWVYLPSDPVIRTAAERAGATYEDGSRLLVYQAATSYGLWWGTEPTEAQVDSALGKVR
ncbi:MAG TPA: type I 3-dehydroquinate dehydratase [Thermoplasmata archaeon]|nr:type I 3-dehydroquinate dehydratase [Thermoplasmata archaeon]